MASEFFRVCEYGKHLFAYTKEGRYLYAWATFSSLYWESGKIKTESWCDPGSYVTESPPIVPEELIGWRS